VHLSTVNTARTLLFEIVRSPWYLDQAVGNQLFPVAWKFIQEGALGLEDYSQLPHPPKMETRESDLSNIRVDQNNRVYYDWDNETPNKMVSIVPVHGIISKYDSSGTYGSRSMANRLRQYDADEKVVAHIINLDTPGGSAAGLKVAADMISQLQKPVVVYIDGVAYSAGMWLASTGTEIYAVDQDDAQLGSIGTMISWVDLKGKIKQEGGEAHIYYATKSTRKNEEFRQAEAGDPSLIYDNILNPHNELFHQAIRNNLPQVNQLDESTQEMIFSGATFSAGEALSFGLINGIATFESVIDRAFALGYEKSSQKIKVR